MVVFQIVSLIWLNVTGVCIFTLVRTVVFDSKSLRLKKKKKNELQGTFKVIVNCIFTLANGTGCPESTGPET